MSFSRRAGSTRDRSAKRDAAAFGAGLDLRDPELLREQLQRRDREQSLQRRRQQPEAIDELDLQRVELGARAAVRDTLVVHEPHVDVGHVVFGNQRREADLDLGPVRERILEVGLVAGAQRARRRARAARCTA